MNSLSNRTADNFVDLLRSHATIRQEQTAVTYLLDGADQVLPQTYGDLDLAARRIAAALQRHGLPGTVVLLVIDPGPDFLAALLGCFYAGVIAAPCGMPSIRREPRRIESTARDTDAHVALTTGDRVPMLTRLARQSACLRQVTWLAVDEFGDAPETWTPYRPVPDALAYLQYTSGSTGDPRGVEISHRNLLENSIAICDAFQHTAESVLLSWMPPHHDMGLVGGILHPIHIGFPTVLLPPTAVVQSPLKWLQAIDRYRANTSGGPNFIYDLCIRAIDDSELDSLDLSCWSIAFNGAEPIREKTLTDFVNRFSRCGLRAQSIFPCYGLAEAVVFVSGGPPGKGPQIRNVSKQSLAGGMIESSPSESDDNYRVIACGRPAVGSQVRIVDPETGTRCSDSQVGEIWVSGPGVARGYFNRPAETEELFHAQLADHDNLQYMRTGDLGFIADDQLYVTGRLKDLIVIDGRNHYPHDIERTVEAAHSAIQPGATAAFSIWSDGESVMVACELRRTRRDVDLHEVFRAVRHAVSMEHELSVDTIAVIRIGRVPKTTSGKIQRKLCRELYLSGQLEVVGTWSNNLPPQDPATMSSAEADDDRVEPADLDELPLTGRSVLGDSGDLERWLRQQIAHRLQRNIDQIDPRVPFASYGLGSRDALEISGEIERYLGREVAATLVYEFPTIRKVVTHLTETEVHEKGIEVATTILGASEPVAIVGLGCRLPGALNVNEYWQLLCDGDDAIRPVPPDHWPIGSAVQVNAYPSIQYGGFLDDLNMFDSRFFGVSSREAAYIDPQHRCLMEVVWEALEDAGLPADSLRGTSTGVFVGISSNDFGRTLTQSVETLDPYWTTGNASCLAANRISYTLDLKGPSFAIDTACSSSLVAAHLALRSLQRRECDVAIVGGANAILSPDVSVSFAQGGGLAHDGRCRAFSAGAGGIGRSEGFGVVVLKRLSDAVANRDSIYATILGGAVNQDGRSNGITAPNQGSQESVLLAAYRDARVSINDVELIETHGAGTLLGDVVEANALHAVMKESSGTSCAEPQDDTRRSDEFQTRFLANSDRRSSTSSKKCALGSVKSNIGHCESAAGVAALIKVSLALKHRMIPPNLHFDAPNPHIPFDEMSFYVPTVLKPWERAKGRRMAGVSSFGFGGTNAHLVLSEMPSVDSLDDTRDGDVDRQEAFSSSQDADTYHLLPLSAASEEALKEVARSVGQRLPDTGSLAFGDDRDLCHFASNRRTHHDFRATVTYRDREQLVAALECLGEGRDHPSVSSGRISSSGPAPLAFVFSGHGAQWWGMAQALYRTSSIFRDSIERCHAGVESLADWSLIAELSADEKDSRLSGSHLEVMQTSLFAFQVALSEMWKGWGIEPTAVVGHSMGEVAAAHVCGSLSLDDSLRVIVHRSRLLEEALNASAGDGAMAAFKASAEEVEHSIRGHEDQVSISVCNSPQYTVLAGNAQFLKDLMKRMRDRKIASRIMNVPGAAHVKELEASRTRLVDLLQVIQPRHEKIEFVSSVTGGSSPGTGLSAEYWGANLQQQVRFADAIYHLLDRGVGQFIEIGPHPLLSAAIGQCAHHHGKEVISNPSVLRTEDAWKTLLSTLGELHIRGQRVDWKSLYPTYRRWISLPFYPWQRERCQLEETASRSSRGQMIDRSETGHPIFGEPTQLALGKPTWCWQASISLQSTRYLADHRLYGRQILPATIYLEAASAAFEKIHEGQACQLIDVEFETAHVVPDQPGPVTQLIIETTRSDNESNFRFHSLNSDEHASGDWIQHAHGMIQPISPDERVPTLGQEPWKHVLERCRDRLDIEPHYATIERCGGGYGPSFRAITELWAGDRESLAHIRSVDHVSDETGYQIHPALLDACIQVLTAARLDDVSIGTSEAMYVPVALRRFHLAESSKRKPTGDHGSLWSPGDHGSLWSPGDHGSLWSHGTISFADENATDTLEGDVTVWNDDGEIVAEFNGLRLRRLESSTSFPAAADPRQWLYVNHWLAQELPPLAIPARPEHSEHGGWLIFPDQSGLATHVKKGLEAAGETCCLATEETAWDFRSASAVRQRINEWIEALEVPLKGVLHMSALDEPIESPTIDDLVLGESLVGIRTLHLTQALSDLSQVTKPRLWLFSRGVQHVPESPTTPHVTGAPLWGFGRTLQIEHPELRATLIDVDDMNTGGGVDMLLRELLSDSRENQIAIRGNSRFVARLQSLTVEDENSRTSLPLSVPDNYRLQASSSGSLDELNVKEAWRTRPKGGEIEIEVAAVGLNFHDVLSALAVRVDDADQDVPLGFECAGKVVATGADVDRFSVGDDVLAICPGSASRYVIARDDLTIAKPSRLTFAQAAALPVALLTADYGLNELGRLKEGETILIHAATGGVGMAALQLARSKGAMIYATAGSEEKREWLRGFGVASVMDSRRLDFAEEIRTSTDAKGVDMILNCLAGDAIDKGLSILKSFGRFVEIGKRDIYEGNSLILRPFRQNLSYFSVDMARLFLERPTYCGERLTHLFEKIESGDLLPLPVQTFPVAEAGKALRHMAQAQHLGKVVLLFDEPPNDIQLAERGPRFVENATYLIAGGLGGLGLVTAQWLGSRGATHVALLGRTPPTDDAAAKLTLLHSAGIETRVLQADVTKRDELQGALKEIRRSMPPLRGVAVLAAGLDDSLIRNMCGDQYVNVTRPKTVGAWNLHELTLEDDLEFFVCYSSIASLIGSPGQANYASGNAFLDSLVEYRRSLGRPALSIHWGPWASVGGAARKQVGRRLRLRGFESIAPEKGMQALQLLMGEDLAAAAVVPVNWSLVRAAYPALAEHPMLDDIWTAIAAADQQGTQDKGESEQDAGARLLAALRDATPTERIQLVMEHLRREVAKTLGTSPERIDQRQSLLSLGIDSLMGLELKNRVEAQLRTPIAVGDMLGGPSVSSLAEVLLERLSPRLTEMSNASSRLPSAPTPVQRAASVDLSHAASDFHASEDSGNPPEQPKGIAEQPKGIAGQPKGIAGQPKGIDSARASDLLKNLDDLPDDEVLALLQQMEEDQAKET